MVADALPEVLACITQLATLGEARRGPARPPPRPATSRLCPFSSAARGLAIRSS